MPPKKSEVKIEEMGGGSKSKEPSRSNSPSVPNEPSVVTKEEAGTVTKTVAEPTVPAENTSGMYVIIIQPHMYRLCICMKL